MDGQSFAASGRATSPWRSILSIRKKGAPYHLGLVDAHEPKKLKLLHSGHCDVYWRKFDEAAEAACDWFQEHLITDQSPPAQGAAFKAA